MTDPVRAQIMGNLVVRALKTRDVPGVENIELALGGEKGTLVVRVIKTSVRHARQMVMDYPFTFTELEQKEPAAHAADIARMIGKADEIGPPLDAETQLALASMAAGRVH